MNYKVVSTTAHAHVISGSSGTTIVNFHASASVHDSKAAIVLTSPAIVDTLEICSDGTEYYIYGDLSGLPSAT